MVTVGRRYAGPRRNWSDRCDYCDVLWPRSELRLDANNNLACPDDYEGRTSIEIDQQRALDAAEPTIVRPKQVDY